MNRILFVDDDLQSLEAIERVLERERHRWEMVFLRGGKAALERMAADAVPFDVVVTELRMAGMHGAELLHWIQEQYPQTVRIVLTGQNEPGASWRLVHTAHQFLTKPWDATVLRETIERSCNLNMLLLDDGLQRTIDQIGQLPALPAVVAELNQVLASPDCTMREIASVVERDPGLSAKVLQLVNSSFFGPPGRTADLEHAVAYLGLDVLTSLAMTSEVLELARDHPRIPGFSLEAEYDHALAVARIARHIGSGMGIGQDAFVVGMLHDLGRLVLAARAPDRLAKAYEEAARSARPVYAVEEEVLGITHAELGAYVLGLWGLPLPLVEAVAFHHHPDRVVPSSIDLLGVVHVADHLAHEITERAAPGGIPHGPIDHKYLAMTGIEADLPGLRGAAAKLFER